MQSLELFTPKDIKGLLNSKKVIEGRYTNNEFDEIYNLNGITTRFVAQSQVLRLNTISTGLGFVFSQYYKEKERWKLIIT